MSKQIIHLVVALGIAITASCGKSVHYFPQNPVEQKIYRFTEMTENAVNINTASIEELQKIPNIGAKTAAKIIEHREKFGTFRKPEHLLLIDRISDARFREMRNLIKTE